MFHHRNINVSVGRRCYEEGFSIHWLDVWLDWCGICSIMKTESPRKMYHIDFISMLNSPTATFSLVSVPLFSCLLTNVDWKDSFPVLSFLCTSNNSCFGTAFHSATCSPGALVHKPAWSVILSFWKWFCLSGTLTEVDFASSMQPFVHLGEC